MKWSNDLAYAIGLIATDGSLSKDGRHIAFVSKDRELIETFKRCMSLRNRVSSKGSGFSKIKSSKYFYIQFGNKKLYNWLMAIGLTPNKTKTIGKIEIPDKFFFDFLRGHLDGDGYYRVYQDPRYPNSQRLYTRFTSASENHIKWLRSRIQYLIGIKGHTRNFDGMSELSFAKNDSKLLLRYMYRDRKSPFLSRKRNIVEAFIN